MVCLPQPWLHFRVFYPSTESKEASHFYFGKKTKTALVQRQMCSVKWIWAYGSLTSLKHGESQRAVVSETLSGWGHSGVAHQPSVWYRDCSFTFQQWLPRGRGCYGSGAISLLNSGVWGEETYCLSNTSRYRTWCRKYPLRIDRNK